MLRKGQRVLITHSSTTNPLATKKLLWEQPIDNRCGCVITNDFMADSEPYVGIVMDHCLNTDPSPKEIEFSTVFNIPGEGRKVFLIVSRDIGHDVTVVEDENFDPSIAHSRASVLCGFKDCPSKVVLRNQTFHSCRKPGHFACCHHCVLLDPVNQETSGKYREFLSIATEYCSSKSIPTSFVQARSIFAFPHWQKARLPHSQAKVLDDYFGSDELPCIVCETNGQSVDSNVALSFGEISSQLSQVQADIAFLGAHHSHSSSTSQGVSNPFDNLSVTNSPSSAVVGSGNASKTAAGRRSPATPPIPAFVDPTPRTAALAVNSGPIRTPTADSPLSSEEVIEALILLRKAVLASGYSYEDVMNAMKKYGAAKMLKTISVEGVRQILVDSLQSSGYQLASTPQSSLAAVGERASPGIVQLAAADTAPNNNNRSTSMMYGSPSTVVINPFDAEIIRHRSATSSRANSISIETDSDNNNRDRDRDPSAGDKAAIESKRKMISVPSLVLPLGAQENDTAKHSLGLPVVPTLAIPIDRSSSADTQHRPVVGPTMGPTIGPSLSSGPMLESDGSPKSLSRTTSKKNKLGGSENGDNPLLFHRSGNLSGRRLNENTEEAEMSIAASSMSNITSNSQTPFPSARSMKDRADMFHRELESSSVSGLSSLNVSAQLSTSSSLANNSFRNLLKRGSSLDEPDAQDRLFVALQEHALSSAAAANGDVANNLNSTSQSRPNSRASNAVEALLMRTHSEEMAALRRIASVESEEPVTGHHVNSSLPPHRSVEMDYTVPVGVAGSSDPLDSLRANRMQSPSSLLIPGLPSGSRRPSNTSSVPNSLIRTSSKDSSLSKPTSVASGPPSVGVGVGVFPPGRLSAFSVDTNDEFSGVGINSTPPTTSTTGDRSPAVQDPASIVRSVDQMMNDSFWRDFEKPSVEVPRTIGDLHATNAPSVPMSVGNSNNVLARNIAVATMAMSEMDALLEESPIEVVATMKMTGGKPPLRKLAQESLDNLHPLPGRRTPSMSDDYDSDSMIAAIVKSSSGSDDMDDVPGYGTPVVRHTPGAHHQHQHQHHHHRGKDSPIAVPNNAVNLHDYPAIKRKLEELAFDLEREGYTREEINDMVAAQSLATLKEVQDKGYFRMLLDSMRAAVAVHERDQSDQEASGSKVVKTATPSPSQPTRRTTTPDSYSGPVRLMRDVRVKLRFPEKCVTSTLVLHRNTLFADVLTTVMADVAAKISSPVIMFVDQEGWSKEIPRECRYTNDCVFTLFDLSDGDVIELRELATASVGPRFRLCHIADADRANDSLRSKVKTLAKSYAGYRKIRGDGNCYYRAVVYGAFEQIIHDGNRQAFRFMYDKFKAVIFSNREHNADHNEFLAALAAASGRFDKLFCC